MSLPVLKIWTDTREQRPLLFPGHIRWHNHPGPHNNYTMVAVKPEKHRLEFGDYSIEGFEDVVCVERKKDSRELKKNILTSDRPRFLSALDRLADGCKRSMLFIEQPPWSWFHATKYVSDKEAEQIMDCLLTELSSRGIILLCGAATSSSSSTARRRLGGFIVRWMVAQIIQLTGSKPWHKTKC